MVWVINSTIIITIIGFFMMTSFLSCDFHCQKAQDLRCHLLSFHAAWLDFNRQRDSLNGIAIDPTWWLAHRSLIYFKLLIWHNCIAYMIHWYCCMHVLCNYAITCNVHFYDYSFDSDACNIDMLWPMWGYWTYWYSTAQCTCAEGFVL